MTGTLNLKTIFGIKLRRFRDRRKLTLAELGKATSLSASYLAEIESGKKYPKADKIWQMAQALGCSYDDLVSTKLGNEFAELQEFLSLPGVRDFPFDLFGVPAGDLVKLLARSPHEVAALIRTISDVAREYSIGVEHFLHAALRCYQELTGNYYPEIEEEADRLRRTMGIRRQQALSLDVLAARLAADARCVIDDETLGKKAELRHFRGVLLAPSTGTVTTTTLLLNPALTDSQKAFLVAREIGYRVLGLSARSLVAPAETEGSFEQVLNDFKASYFAGALLLPRDRVLADVRTFFALPTWQGEALLRLLDRHHVTAETWMYRLSQLVPGEFALRTHFLKFSDAGGHFRLVKQLNLSDLPVPPGIGGSEHYCRRWLSTRLLVEAATWRQRRPRHAHRPIVDAQRSRFADGKEFLCLGLAQPQPLQPEITTSLTLGFIVDARLLETIKFASDRTIPDAEISGTCERCPLAAHDCADRAALPTLNEEEEARARRKRELDRLVAGPIGSV